MKSERRRDLVRILREGRARKQQEIVEALRSAGHNVTQATVSRDLHAVGAMKLRVEGESVYRLADDVSASATGDLLARDLERTLIDFAIDVRVAHSLVVVLTAPGHAAAVARAIDHGGNDAEVVGTVAGDDTILVATPSPEVARSLTETWLRAAHIVEVSS